LKSSPLHPHPGLETKANDGPLHTPQNKARMRNTGKYKHINPNVGSYLNYRALWRHMPEI
jgi:hypothetical protein